MTHGPPSQKPDLSRLRIGYASPVSLQHLRDLVSNADELPIGYEFSPAATWVRELVNRGHHITIYSTSRDIQAPRTFRGEDLTIRLAPLRPSGTGKDFFRKERRYLTEMMAEDKCDIIHAHWTYEFPLAALSAGRPTLITVHDLPWNVLRYFRDKFRLARLLMAYEVALRGKHFTAVSQDAASHFRRYFCPWCRIDVVPNGVDDALFQRPLSPSGPRAFTFATVLQGWSRRKNGASALLAFAQLQRTLPDSRLIMFGRDYEPGGPAETWAEANSATRGVEFCGLLPYPQLLDRLEADVDIVVHPSLDESFSMAAVEAMALHKPVIAGQETPGVREVLGFGKAGLLVDVRDPADLARGMVTLLEDSEKRSYLAEQGFQRAYAKYRTGHSIDLYEQLYRQLAGKHRA